IDDKGKPTAVPPLEIKNNLQQCRADAALERKNLRMQSSNRPSCDFEEVNEQVGEHEEHDKVKK
ncbi:MAG: hypothetical protein ACTH5U_07265, partial [Pseudomonadales bacterium]